MPVLGNLSGLQQYALGLITKPDKEEAGIP